MDGITDNPETPCIINAPETTDCVSVVALNGIIFCIVSNIGVSVMFFLEMS
jgi:hypothetical protein